MAGGQTSEIQSFAAEVVADAVRTRGATGVPSPVASLKLKPRQAAVLEFIRATIRHRGIGPSIQRIRDAGICGRENAQVYRVIGQLIRMGIICRGGPPLPHTNEPSLVVIEQAIQ